MERKLTQKDLKEAVTTVWEGKGNTVKKVSFDTEMDNDKPLFRGMNVTFDEDERRGHRYSFLPGDTAAILMNYYEGQNLDMDIDSVRFEMSTRTTADGKIPVFKGVTVDVQEMKQDTGQREAREPMPDVSKMLLNRQRTLTEEDIAAMSDREFLEAVQAHFASHPTLPGEKILKGLANEALTSGETELHPSVRSVANSEFADVRIRETKMMAAESFDPNRIYMEPVASASANNMAIDVYSVPAVLVRTEDGVLVKAPDLLEIPGKSYPGKSDKFLTNNPMNAEWCEAMLQMTDYSNGKMKNVSARVIVDTDLMSGDAISLNEEMLAGLDLDTGLER